MREFNKDKKGFDSKRSSRPNNNIRSWNKDDRRRDDRGFDNKPKFDRSEKPREEIDFFKEWSSIKSLEENINEYSTILKNLKGISNTDWFKNKFNALTEIQVEYINHLEIYVARLTSISENKKERFNKNVSSSNQNIMDIVSRFKELDKEQKESYKTLFDEYLESTKKNK
ncbi:hypothetical protein [Mycoplasma crocodyli]|uniref:hypothetical protein n=1 Tax=Mycoplasma crocodyli TaxID=50052 RepID=UPI00031C0BAF|nr:hypothetical protein [Mycoplasma crocodyli]